MPMASEPSIRPTAARTCSESRRKKRGRDSGGWARVSYMIRGGLGGGPLRHDALDITADERVAQADEFFHGLEMAVLGRLVEEENRHDHRVDVGQDLRHRERATGQLPLRQRLDRQAAVEKFGEIEGAIGL